MKKSLFSFIHLLCLSVIVTAFSFSANASEKTSLNTNKEVDNKSALITAPILLAPSYVSGYGFTINWTAPVTGVADNYLVTVATDAAFASPVASYNNVTVPGGGSATSFTAANLASNTTYYYRVTAVSGPDNASAQGSTKTTAFDGFGNVLRFGGYGNKVAMASTSTGISFPSNAWTQEFWLYAVGQATGQGITTSQILGSTLNNNNRPPSIYISNSTTLKAGYGDGTSYKEYSLPNALTLNSWNHVAVTFDGTTISIYINGTLAGNQNLAGTSNNFKLSHIGVIVNSFAFDLIGRMDELRIWDYARTPAQIGQNYNKTISPTTNGLLAYYDFDQGIANGDNQSISTLIDAVNPTVNNGAMSGFQLTPNSDRNFIGYLNTSPTTTTNTASSISNTSFNASWAPANVGTFPAPSNYSLYVSTDPTFADASKFATGYQGKNVGNTTSASITGLTANTTYYYRVATYYSPSARTITYTNTVTVTTNNFSLAANDTRTYGDAPYQLAVTTNSSAALTYAAAPGGSVSISNTGTINILKTGWATVTVNQAGNSSYTANTATQTIWVNAKPITATIIAANKVYDGNAAASVTPTLVGVIPADMANVTVTVGTSTFNNKGVANNKPVTASTITLGGSQASNYVLVSTSATTNANITAKPVTLTLTASNKQYDGNASASATFAITGTITGDNVMAASTSVNFDTPNVGIGKTVTANGATLTGTDKDNYTAVTQVTTTANITSKAVTVTITSASNKVYDGNAAAAVNATLTGVIAPDAVNVSVGTSTFNDKNVGTGKPVTASSITLTGANANNYTLSNTTANATATITAKSVTVTLAANNKAYDGNATASGTLTLAGAIGGDNVSAASTSVNFSDPNIGNNKTVTANGISLTGNSASNYLLTNTTATTTASITGKQVTVSITANNKVYDGKINAVVTPTLTGVNSPDVVTVSVGSSTFNNKNVANGKTVTATNFILGGPNASNYVIANSTATATANVTSKTVTVTLAADNKVYDGNTDATGALIPVGMVANDALGATATSIKFDNANIGTNKAVTATNITLTGADLANYTLTNTSATATAYIAQKGVTVTIAQANSKVYDGTTAATVTYNITGLTAGDSATITRSIVVFNNKNVGNNKLVTASNFTLDNTNYAAYNLNATATANVTPATLTITADDKNRLINQDNPPLTISYNGFVSGEDNIMALSTQPTATTAAVKASPAGSYQIAVTGAVAANGNYTIVPKNGTLTVNDVPVSTTFVASTLYKGNASGSEAGTLSATSSVANDTFTYTLEPGAVDNDKFIIQNNKILTNTSFGATSPTTYTVKVKTTSNAGGVQIIDFVITVSNATITAQDFVSSPVYLSSPSGTLAGTLSASSSVANDTFTYSLAPGVADNNKFIIQDNKILTNTTFTPASPTSYTVKVKVTSKNGGVQEKDVVITVFNAVITAANITNNPLLYNNSPSGSLAGTLSASSSVANDTFTYTLVPGAADNNKFIIQGDKILTNPSFASDYPTTYTVRVRITSLYGGVQEKDFVITLGKKYADVKPRNIITTNGDGVNDTWYVQNIERYPEAVVKVFDKTGRIVFTQANYNNQWNGYYNGKPLTEGTYYYIIDFDKGIYKIKGYINIVNQQ